MDDRDDRDDGADDQDDEQSTAMDVKLFETIGLYRLLRPRDAIGRRCRAALLWMVYAAFALQSTQAVGLYFSINDFQRFANMAVLLNNGVLSVYKGYVVVTNADRIWATLSVARYAHVSCTGRDPAELRRSLAALSPVLRAFVAFSYATLFIWIAVPYFMTETVPIVGPDGTVGQYRMTIVNLWTPLTAAVYNRPSVWALVYVTEAFMIAMNVASWALFDCYLVTMCFVLNAQFHTMASAYEKLGVPQQQQKPSDASGDGTENNEIKVNDHYEELINHIKDNQRIMKKLDDFFDIVRPVILVQVVNGSFSVVILIFILSLLYMMGESIASPPFVKFFSGFASLTMQLYIYCYAFNHIETKKCLVNLGLYGSNWTVMDLKYKKTLLMAMKMNDAHNRQMKVAPTSIVNLVMFARVMNMSYSIVPVLLNSSTAGKEEAN